jgi:hypothetical protein
MWLENVVDSKVTGCCNVSAPEKEYIDDIKSKIGEKRRSENSQKR